MEPNFPLAQSAIDSAVRANGGRAFITGETLNRNERVRDALERMADALGMPEPKVQGLESSKLAMLYATARKDIEKAARTAATWSDNSAWKPSSTNPLLDPMPAPEPASQAPQAPQIDVEAILESARKEASAMADYIAMDRLDGAMAAIEKAAHDAATKALESLAPTRLEVKLPKAASVNLGTVHYNQARLIRMLGAGCNVYLYGPAGSGKTTAAQKCAEAFKLPFYFTGKIDSEYLLLGFKNAQGETVRTPFREAYEHGGVFLFDEVDRSAPNAFTALNAALANGVCSFPDGVVKMHKDFKCIAAGNTRMSGADNTYTAGQQQDGASIDRFAFLEWLYDESLELSLASNKGWCRYVQAVRAEIAQRGINHLVTPRATFDGCKLLACGDTWDEAASACIWKGLDPATVAAIDEATRQHREAA